MTLTCSSHVQRGRGGRESHAPEWCNNICVEFFFSPMKRGEEYLNELSCKRAPEGQNGEQGVANLFNFIVSIVLSSIRPPLAVYSPDITLSCEQPNLKIGHRQHEQCKCGRLSFAKMSVDANFWPVETLLLVWQTQTVCGKHKLSVERYKVCQPYLILCTLRPALQLPRQQCSLTAMLLERLPYISCCAKA